jgi:zinc transporter ZupT
MSNRSSSGWSSLPSWVVGLIPILLFGALTWAFIAYSPIQRLSGDIPPVEDLTINRVELKDRLFVLHVVNGGRDAVTIAQVQVDEAYRHFRVEPASGTIGRLETARILVPYPWVSGEAHELRIVTNTGLTFDHTVEVAVHSPEPDSFHWWVFALIGIFVGVIPVGLGLMWFPLLQRLPRSGLRFMLALTIGLLVFLLVDTVAEALEIAEGVSEIFHAAPLLIFAGLLSFALLVAVGNRKQIRDRSTPEGRHWIAMAIAIGIGLHNLGEGMAIGAATALGEVALGTFLVLGFALHNITEGIGIGAPMAPDRPGFSRLLWLAIIAGGPAVPGVWVGGFSFSPLLAVLFLSIGAGAILQVIYEVGKLLVARGASDASASSFDWVNVGGVTAGIAVMYATALFVA